MHIVPRQLVDRLGSAFTPVALTSTTEEIVASIPGHVPFGHSVSAACAARAMTAREQQFRCLDHTIHSWLPTGLRLPVINVSRDSLTIFER